MKENRSRALRCGAFLAMAFFGIAAMYAQGAGSQPTASNAAGAVRWRSVIFGQSITAKDDSVTIGEDGSVVVSSLNGKGKVTGAHDGIAYYYVTLDPSAFNFSLSADIEVLTYANDNDSSKPKPNNQEGFGIMVRDAIGADGDSSVFASNMVYGGGYRGQIQAVLRENVEERSGYGAKTGSVPLDPKFPGKGSKFRLTVMKTNSGYQVFMNGDRDGGTMFYRPSLMQVQDKTKLYAGFFAARNASIRVSGIELALSDPATDPPAAAEPPKPVVPALNVASPLETSSEEYGLIVSANVDGILGASKGGVPLFSGQRLFAGIETVRTIRLASGENGIDLDFVLSEGQFLASEAPVAKQVKIVLKSFGDPSVPLFVSPSGKPDGDGTKEKALDIATAVKFAQEGQSVVLADGVYKMGSALVIQRGNDGTSSAPKRLTGSGAGNVTLSFEDSGPGLQLMADWWILSGFSVTKSTSTGIRVAGNHDRVERCTAFANANTGIQISGSSLDPGERWPSNNTVSGCVSHDNRDAAESDADGFAAKLTVGPGNVFENCVARNNCDDGWDLYTKLETGAIGAVKVERCVAYANGIMSGGNATKGDGNGFKLGGEGIAVAHEIDGCFAFANKAGGFTVNSNPAVSIGNSVSADNGGANFVFSLYPGATQAFALESLYSWRSAPGPADNFASSLLSDTVYLYDGDSSKNGAGLALIPGLFATVIPPAGEILPGDDAPEMGGYLTPIR